jgi:hypothetical protein
MWWRVMKTKAIHNAVSFSFAENLYQNHITMRVKHTIKKKSSTQLHLKKEHESTPSW